MSTTSPPPASSTGAALTGASDILGVDGGLGRLEGTGAENVVGAQGHGVHPVSVALQRAAQDPLGTKPPSDRDRQDTARLHSTHHTHWAARTNPKLSKPAPAPAAGRLSREDITLLSFRNQFPLHNTYQLRLLQGCFQLLAPFNALKDKNITQQLPLANGVKQQVKKIQQLCFSGHKLCQEEQTKLPHNVPNPLCQQPKGSPSLTSWLLQTLMVLSWEEE